MNYQNYFLISSTFFLLAIHSVIVQAQNPKLPEIATIEEMTNGDLACYVNLVDNKGKKYEGIFADFSICEQEKKFLNKKVKIVYGKAKFNDCESVESCGKTKVHTAILKMHLIEQKK
jgi:hypothetical protein